MVVNLDSLVASLPAKQEQKRLQDLDERRQQILAKFSSESIISKVKDPRKLNSVQQCMYIIKCLENGLTKAQIVDLFYADQFSVDTVINVLGVNKLVTHS